MKTDGSGPVLSDGGRVPSVSWRGAFLYAPRDPDKIPERIAREAPLPPDTLFVIPSPLLGYGLPTLLERLGGGSALLLIEAEGELESLARERAPRELLAHPRVRFVTATPEAAVLAARSLGRFRRAVELVLSRGRSLAPSTYDAVMAALEADFQTYWRNRATMARMGRLWTRNLLDNLGRLPYGRLKPLPSARKPLLVAGAGPSLDRAMPWILSRRARLAIIAVDTALPCFRARGIEPDAVVVLEGQAHNLRDFAGGAGNRIRLFADLSSHPAGFRHVGGSVHAILTRWDELALLDRAGRLPFIASRTAPLGSVGVLAASLSARLGSVPLILAGLDFSYEAGRSHASGAPFPEAEDQRRSRLRQGPSLWSAAYGGRSRVATRSGERSDPLLSAYASTLQRELAPFAGRTLDLRGGGLELGLARGRVADADAVLDAFGAPEGAAFEDRGDYDASVSRAATASFLERERDSLLALRSSLRNGTGGLEDAAATCDGYWAHFADPDRARELPLDFRNRLLVETFYWEDRIDRASAFLRERA
ncbi:MAG: DUF115 domain-containing protein [Spirochaetales bacterium]|nr:DUF115 domain-containing protein [Spirochaetales bacterium]